MTPTSSTPHRHVAARLYAVLLGAVATIAPGPAMAQKFSTLPTIDGLGNTGSVSEGMLAVGPRYVLQFIQGPLQFYTKSTMQPVGSPVEGKVFFGTGNNGPGDPLCHYDALRGRYLVVAMLGAHIYLAVSTSDLNNTSTPFDESNWHKYDLDLSSVQGSTDYPGLGLSDDKIAITIGLPSTAEAKNLVVLDRVRAYDGTYNHNLTPADLSVVPLDPTLHYKACRNLTASNTIHIVGVKTCSDCPSSDCNRVDHYTLTGAPPVSSSNLALVKAGVVSATDGPNNTTQQLGASNLSSGAPTPVNVNSEFADIYMRSNHVTVAWTVGHDYGDGNPPSNAVHVVRFDASTSSDVVLDDFVAGLPGIDFVHGSAYEDPLGALFVGYDRNSPEDYLGSAMQAIHGSLRSAEFRVTTSASVMERHKATGDGIAAWGDFTSMVMDESVAFGNVSRLYYLGQWADPAGPGPGTKIGRMLATYSTGSISGTVTKTILGAYKAGVPVVLQASPSGAPLDSTTTDGLGAFTFGSIPGGSYIVHEVMDPGAAVSSSIGQGGFAQTALTNTDIFVQLKSPNALVATGLQFVVAEQTLPVVSTISPSFVSQNPSGSTSVVVTGSSFVAWSIVRVDGRPQPTTYQSSTQLTVSVPASCLRTTAAHMLTVFTSGGSGTGVSNAVPLMIVTGVAAATSVTTPAARVLTCPGGDADHIVTSVVVHDQGNFYGADATATFQLQSCPRLSLGFWGLVAGSTSSTTGATVQAVRTAGPGAGEYTFSVDVSQVIGCARMTGAWLVVSNHLGTIASFGIQTPDIDIRSYEVDPLQSVSDAVDRYDQQHLSAALGTQEICSDLNRDGLVTSQDQALLNAHLTHHGNPRQFTAPVTSFVNKGTQFLEGLYYVGWYGGHGPASRVTLSKIVGATETVLASNIPTTGEDPGLFAWAACDEPNAQNMTLRLLYTAGPNDGPAAVLADVQSVPFQFTGSCSFGLSGPVIESSEAGHWRREAAMPSPGAPGTPTDVLVSLPGLRNLTGGRIHLRASAPKGAGIQLGGLELFSTERSPDEVSLLAGGEILVGRVAHECVASLSPAVGVDARALLARAASAKPASREEDEEEGAAAREPGIPGPDSPIAVTVQALSDEQGPIGGLVIERQQGGTWSRETVLDPTDVRTFVVEPGQDLRVTSVNRTGRCELRIVELRTDAQAVRVPHVREAGAPGFETGGGPATLREGEDLTLAFEARPATSGMARDFFAFGKGIRSAAAGGRVPLPMELELLRPRPNPALRSVDVGFALPHAEKVRLQVFDVRGRQVRTLVDELRPAGRYDIHWNLRDAQDRPVAPGMYFFRLQTASRSLNRKLTVMP